MLMNNIITELILNINSHAISKLIFLMIYSINILNKKIIS